MIQILNLGESYAEEHIPRYGPAETTTTVIDRGYGFATDLVHNLRLSSEQGDVLFFQSPE